MRDIEERIAFHLARADDLSDAAIRHFRADAEDQANACLARAGEAALDADAIATEHGLEVRPWA